VDFWKGQPAGASDGHTVGAEDGVSAAHTCLAREFHTIVAVPKMANTRKIWMANGIRKRFRNMLLAPIVDHLAAAGMTRLLFGGNAFLYHLSLKEYEQILGWLESLPNHLWCIPSA
jgi:hypothetical protein